MSWVSFFLMRQTSPVTVALQTRCSWFQFVCISPSNLKKVCFTSSTLSLSFALDFLLCSVSRTVSDAPAPLRRMQGLLLLPFGLDCVFISLSPLSLMINSCIIHHWWPRRAKTRWTDQMLVDRCGCKLESSRDREVGSEDGTLRPRSVVFGILKWDFATE